MSYMWYTMHGGYSIIWYIRATGTCDMTIPDGPLDYQEFSMGHTQLRLDTYLKEGIGEIIPNGFDPW